MTDDEQRERFGRKVFDPPCRIADHTGIKKLDCMESYAFDISILGEYTDELRIVEQPWRLHNIFLAILRGRNDPTNE